jgi:hypothetical protein
MRYLSLWLRDLKHLRIKNLLTSKEDTMFELTMLVGLIGCVATTLIKKEVKMVASTPITGEHIMVNCGVRAGTLYPCLKQQVYACLETVDGERFYGANWMLNNTVTVCPRVTEGCATGTGYNLCTEVCGQGPEYHAERQAIAACLEAGKSTVGATMYLTGHTYCCETCTAAMIDAGVTAVQILDTKEVVNY